MSVFIKVREYCKKRRVVGTGREIGERRTKGNGMVRVNDDDGQSEEQAVTRDGLRYE